MCQYSEEGVTKETEAYYNSFQSIRTSEHGSYKAGHTSGRATAPVSYNIKTLGSFTYIVYTLQE